MSTRPTLGRPDWNPPKRLLYHVLTNGFPTETASNISNTQNDEVLYFAWWIPNQIQPFLKITTGWLSFLSSISFTTWPYFRARLWKNRTHLQLETVQMLSFPNSWKRKAATCMECWALVRWVVEWFTVPTIKLCIDLPSKMVAPYEIM